MVIDGTRSKRMVYVVGDCDLFADRFLLLYSCVKTQYDTGGLVFFEDRRKLYEEHYQIASRADIEELKKDG